MTTSNALCSTIVTSILSLQGGFRLPGTFGHRHRVRDGTAAALRGLKMGGQVADGNMPLDPSKGDRQQHMDGRIAVLKHTRGPWDLERYQVPDPEPGALIVKITYANVCGSDLHWWRGEQAIDPRGRVMGHEMTGRIAALGAGVSTDSTGKALAEGDRII